MANAVMCVHVVYLNIAKQRRVGEQEGRIRGTQTSGLAAAELKGVLPSWTSPTTRAQDGDSARVIGRKIHWSGSEVNRLCSLYFGGFEK